MKRVIERTVQALLGMSVLIIVILSVLIFSSFPGFFDQQTPKNEETEESITEESITEESITEDVLIRPRDLSLQKELDEYLFQHGLDEQSISYRITDLDNHEIYTFNEETDFFAASVYKLPLAMLYEDMIDEGVYTRESLFYFAYSMIEDYGYLLSLYSPGSYVPLGDLLDIMIAYSDNSAGHILFEYMDGWLGYKNAMMAYTDVDCQEFYTYNNITCAAVMSDIVNHLYENKEKYAHLIDIMEEAEPGRFLDGNISISMPQKYGSYEDACNSVGFVDGSIPYTIVVLTSLGSYGEKVMADLNEIVYRHLVSDVSLQ